MTEVSEIPEVLVVGETLIDFIPNKPGPLAETETFSEEQAAQLRTSRSDSHDSITRRIF